MGIPYQEKAVFIFRQGPGLARTLAALVTTNRYQRGYSKGKLKCRNYIVARHNNPRIDLFWLTKIIVYKLIHKNYIFVFSIRLASTLILGIIQYRLVVLAVQEMLL